MRNKVLYVVSALFLLIQTALIIFGLNMSSNELLAEGNKEKFMLEKSEQEWKEELTEEEYRVLREKGTERPFTGKYDKFYENGDYNCAGCGMLLFTSETKYDSGCGWPAFYDVQDSTKIKYIRDTSFGMIRTEVVCAGCGGHLGHVFEDGPRDKTGLRYCINSVSLDFKEDKKANKANLLL